VTRYGVATYDLYEIQALLRDPCKRFITRGCRKNAVSLGFSDDEDIIKRILKLTPTEIYKTMTSNRIPGLWQDVYHSPEGTIVLYIKLQKSFNGQGVVIQLKESTSRI
jgi:hypothetical protein